MPELADFQDRFADSLASEAPAAGLTVYRNTIAQGLVATLAGTFPTVRRLTGEAWFAQHALAFARAYPPTGPVLAEYGEAFPAWLPQPDGLGYLADIARLDWAWALAYRAADAEPLRDAPFDICPTLHPAARLLAFDQPAVTLWRLNRPPAPILTEPVQPDWVAEACLVSRPAGEVLVTDLDAAGHGFVAACIAGTTFGAAAVALLERQPQADLAGLIARLLAAGAFSA